MEDQGFENKFEKAFKARFSNIWVPSPKAISETDRVDGFVLGSIGDLEESRNFPITSKKILSRLTKDQKIRLKKLGGIKASLSRLEALGPIYKDDETKGWKID